MNQFTALLPELVVAITLVGLVLSEVTHYGERIRLVFATVVLGLFAALLYTAFIARHPESYVLLEMLRVDSASIFFKTFFILLTLLTILICRLSTEIKLERQNEYFILVLVGCLAGCVLSSAINGVLIYLGLVLLHIVAVFLASFNKAKIVGTESGMKFLILSIVASSLYLLGFGVLFAETGTVNLLEIASASNLSSLPASRLILIGVLLFGALGFSIGILPGQFWVPDVIQGAPTPTSLFVGLGIPAAGIVVALRFFTLGFDSETIAALQFREMFAFSAAATMLIGSALAIHQVHAKRLLACLLLAQIGFFSLAYLVLDSTGTSTLFYNLLGALIAFCGAFCCYSVLFDSKKLNHLNSNASHRFIIESFALLMFMACIVGFPPFPTFVGRFALLGAIVKDGWNLLAVVSVISNLLCIVAFSRLAFSLVGQIVKAPVKAPTSFSDVFKPRTVFLFALFVPLILMIFFSDHAFQWGNQHKNIAFLW